jgi:hypothetical protein
MKQAQKASLPDGFRTIAFVLKPLFFPSLLVKFRNMRPQFLCSSFMEHIRLPVKWTLDSAILRPYGMDSFSLLARIIYKGDENGK